MTGKAESDYVILTLVDEYDGSSMHKLAFRKSSIDVIRPYFLVDDKVTALTIRNQDRDTIIKEPFKEVCAMLNAFNPPEYSI